MSCPSERIPAPWFTCERRLRRSFCWVLALLTTCAAPASAQAPGLGTPTVLAADGGPTVVARPGLGVPLVTIRLSVPVNDAAHPGAGRVLAHLASPDLEGAVASTGGTAVIERRPARTVYTVTGPARSFDLLAAAVRSAVLDPPFTTDALRRATATARHEIRATLERPEPRIRALLRQRLSPVVLATADDTAPLGRLDLEGIRHLWSSQYLPARMNVLVVGNIPRPVVRSAFAWWSEPAVPGSPPDTATPPRPRPEPQLLLPWAGLGYRLPVAEPAVAVVAAELVRRRVVASALTDGTAEVWWHPDAHALVVLGSAQADTPALRAARSSSPALTAGPSDEALGASDLVLYLRRMVAEAAALLHPDAVTDAARALRFEIRHAARTARGLAAFAGGLHDATGRHDAADRLLRGLHGVDAGAVQTLLRQLLSSNPAFVEVRP